MPAESLFALTAAVVGGGLGALTLIGMLADYLQTREQSFDDATDWDRLVESSFHHDREF